MPLPLTTLSGVFQIAYVVRDMEKAVETLSAAHRIAGFRVAVFELNLSFPKQPTTLKVALGWVDDHEIEMIEPILDGTDIFAPAVPAPPANMAFHHLAMRIHGSLEDWERFRATIADDRVVIAGGREGMRFIYIDVRDTLGHYLEYIWMGPQYLSDCPWRVPPSQR